MCVGPQCDHVNLRSDCAPVADDVTLMFLHFAMSCRVFAPRDGYASPFAAFSCQEYYGILAICSCPVGFFAIFGSLGVDEISPAARFYDLYAICRQQVVPKHAYAPRSVSRRVDARVPHASTVCRASPYRDRGTRHLFLVGGPVDRPAPPPLAPSVDPQQPPSGHLPLYLYLHSIIVSL